MRRSRRCQTIEREGRRIVAEQERAEIRLELQRDQERAWRRELDRAAQTSGCSGTDRSAERPLISDKGHYRTYERPAGIVCGKGVFWA